MHFSDDHAASCFNNNSSKREIIGYNTWGNTVAYPSSVVFGCISDSDVRKSDIFVQWSQVFPTRCINTDDYY